MNEIPKYMFDKEYSTQWRKEVQFLEDKGINYVYAKKHPKYPITVYKYTKTPELFLALADFYNQVRTRSTINKIDKLAVEIMPIEKGCIEVKASELTEPEKKLMNITEQDVVNILDDTE